MLSLGAIVFSLVTLASASAYSDTVYRRELRIQVGMNVHACLESVTLMVSRDYFLNGTTTVPEFGCDVVVSNDFNGNVSIGIQSLLERVKGGGDRILNISDNGVRVISENVW